jgi:hypothetical protein
MPAAGIEKTVPFCGCGRAASLGNTSFCMGSNQVRIAQETTGPYYRRSSSATPSQLTGVELMSFLREFGRYLRRRKNYWMIPIMLTLVLIGGLLVLQQGSVLATMIYTMF